MTNNRPWSAVEKALFAQLRADGLSMSEISTRLCRSEVALSRQLERMDLPRRPARFKPGRPKPKKSGKTTLPPLPSLSMTDARG